MNSLYIHIPFCQSRCIYCDFYSTTLGQEYMTAYVAALKHELVQRTEEYIKGTRVHSIYIGGGTPSLLPTDRLKELFAAIDSVLTFDENTEVTIEANPDDVTEEWLRELGGTPINRISMGAQTFNDRLLSFLGRRHNSQQTVDAVKACKEAGLTNISLDLIYGMPGQIFDIWQDDVTQALNLGITHLSAYALSYEEGTRLSKMLQAGLVKETDEELSRKMYDYLMSATKEAGFLHYEISNFAIPGYHSRHNSSYWQSSPYLGLGAGAHSYDGERTRRANLPDIKAYIAATEDVPHETEVLSDTDLYNEFIMTRLRTSSGIPLKELSEKDCQYCLTLAKPHLSRGLLCIKNEHICLTPKGIFTSNDIISDLMKIDE